MVSNELKLRFTDAIMFDIETRRGIARIINKLLKDNPVDDSKVEYIWNIMGKE